MIATTTYCFRNVYGLSGETLLRVWRTRWDSFTTAAMEYNFSGYPDELRSKLKYEWESIEPLTPADVAVMDGETPNMRWRRLLFWAIRPEVLFSKLTEPEDWYVDQVDYPVWHEDNPKPIATKTVTRRYEVYHVAGELIGAEIDCCALKCWDYSTGQEQWILVPSNCDLVDLALAHVLPHGIAYRQLRVRRQGDTVWLVNPETSSLPLPVPRNVKRKDGGVEPLAVLTRMEVET